MNPNFSRSERSNFRFQTHGDTTDSNSEMYYMDPNVLNTIMSPITQGRQSTNRNPSPLDGLGKSIISTVKMDLRERTDTAQIIGEQPIKSLKVSIPRGSSEERMECSPKTINVGDSREQAEYNIRTANVRLLWNNLCSILVYFKDLNHLIKWGVMILMLLFLVWVVRINILLKVVWMG